MFLFLLLFLLLLLLRPLAAVRFSPALAGVFAVLGVLGVLGVFPVFPVVLSPLRVLKYQLRNSLVRRGLFPIRWLQLG